MTEFRTVVAGTPRPKTGQVLYVMRYPYLSEWEEYRIQRLAGGSGYLPALQDRYVATEPLVKKAAQLALTQKTTWQVVQRWRRPGPLGTVVGVKTRRWGKSLADAFALWDLPPFTQTPNLYGIVQEPPSVDLLTTYNILYGYIMEVEISPSVYIRWDFSIATKPSGEQYVDVDVVNQEWNVPTARHYLHDENQPWFTDIMRIYIKQSADDPGPDRSVLYHLYHTHEINCEITPPHGTALAEGQMVYITATPDENRYLTEFIVQGEEKLPGAFLTPTADEQQLIDAGIETDQSDNAAHWYGPVTSDVYVGAAAYGIDLDLEITAGIPITQQMTCNDCYAGEWSLGETDLPESVEMSIDPTGLLRILIPEDIYEGLPGGEAYLEIIFKGFSQTLSRTLRLTVLPVPAFGTVWDAVTLLAEPINDIILCSDGYLYIVGNSKIWKAPTDLSEFNEVAQDGSAITNAFFNIVETANGSLVVSDGKYLWMKEAEASVFSRTTMMNAITKSYGVGCPLTGSIASNLVVSTSDTLNNARAYVYDVSNSSLVASYLMGNDGLVGVVSYKGVVADDGSFIIPYHGAGTGMIYQIAANGLTGALRLYDEDVVEGCVIKEENGGKLYFLTGTKYSTSSDDGATWTPATTSPSFSYHGRAGVSLKKNYAVFGRLTTIRRTTDAVATTTEVKASIGTVNCFCLLNDRTILCGTSGGATNLWKSEA